MTEEYSKHLNEDSHEHLFNDDVSLKVVVATGTFQPLVEVTIKETFTSEMLQDLNACSYEARVQLLGKAMARVLKMNLK